MRSCAVTFIRILSSPQTFFRRLREASAAGGTRIYESFMFLAAAAAAGILYSIGSGIATGELIRGLGQALTITSLAGGMYLLTGAVLSVRATQDRSKLPMPGVFGYSLYTGLSVVYVMKHLLT